MNCRPLRDWSGRTHTLSKGRRDPQDLEFMDLPPPQIGEKWGGGALLRHLPSSLIVRPELVLHPPHCKSCYYDLCTGVQRKNATSDRQYQLLCPVSTLGVCFRCFSLAVVHAKFSKKCDQRPLVSTFVFSINFYGHRLLQGVGYSRASCRY